MTDPTPAPLLAGKTCLITGASRGIGKHTAIGLARLGARLVLVCRDAGRAQAALDEIRVAAAGAPAGVEILLADLASLASIRAAAEEARRRLTRLDVLVNNAGVLYLTRRTTVDGLEATFAVNHLAYFLFTLLLLPLLEAAAPARVVSVSSALHWKGALDFADLQHERRYGGFRAYADSKLANVLFTNELARRLAGRRVTANCLHPGAVASHFGHDNPLWFRILLALVWPFEIGPEKGARTSIRLAAAPELEGVTGKYFSARGEEPTAPVAHDPEVARRLWEASAALAGVRGDLP